jgi:hypothetical protein
MIGIVATNQIIKYSNLTPCPPLLRKERGKKRKRGADAPLLKSPRLPEIQVTFDNIFLVPVLSFYCLRGKFQLDQQNKKIPRTTSMIPGILRGLAVNKLPA